MMYEPLYYYVLGRCTEWNTEGKQFAPESEAFGDFVWRTYTQVRKVQTHFAVLDASFSDFEISVCEGLGSFLHPREAEAQQERDELLTAFHNYIEMPEFDGTQKTSAQRRDIKRAARKAIAKATGVAV